MGSSYISGFTEILGDGDQALETAVRIQLKGNHYLVDENNDKN